MEKDRSRCHCKTLILPHYGEDKLDFASDDAAPLWCHDELNFLVFNSLLVRRCCRSICFEKHPKNMLSSQILG
jgi:hypothetical protein